MITSTPIIVNETRDRERDEDHDRLDLVDVGVRAGHQLAGLRLVVEREVQPLQVGEQPMRRSVSTRSAIRNAA